MTSVHNRFISNEQAVPVVVDDRAFRGESERRFAVGFLGNGGSAADGLDILFTAYQRLRANVYVFQTGMLAEEVLREDGTESDSDDARSAHFVVVENRRAGTAIFACMRIIQKHASGARPLPIEVFFPEIFATDPAPAGAAEVSRFIVRSDERSHKTAARAMLLSTATGYVMKHALDPVYAVVEPELESFLLKSGVPFVRVAEPKWVEEYNDYNLAIRIDANEMASAIDAEGLLGRGLELGGFRYW